MFWRRRKGSDFGAEIEAHIQQEAERLREQGMSEDEARAAARRAFGNVMRAEENFFEATRWMWLDHLWQDVRFGLRMLRKTPGFTLVVILTLALGIGANTAIFSLINAVALRSLPVPNPQQLVLLQWTARKPPSADYFARFGGCPSGSGRHLLLPTACSFSYSMFERTRAVQEVFSGALSFTRANATIRVNDRPASLSGMYVSGDFFSTLGTRAAAGRTLNMNDDLSGAEPVIVLSYRYWKGELASDPSVLGRTATVNLKPFRIVGITGSDFPDFDPGVPVDFWMPLVGRSIVEPRSPSRAAENSLWLYVLARLKPGVTIGRAEAAVNAALIPGMTSGAAPLFHAADGPRITLYSAAEGLASLRAEYAKPLYILMTAVGLILVLSCANVAGLLLARSSARQKEVSVRSALGAPRHRIVRQLLTESLLLSAVGGALGIAIATVAAKALVAFLSANSYAPLQLDVGIDRQVLGFTLLVSIGVGIVFGLAPALRASRVDVARILKLSGGPSGTVPRQSAILGNLLVVAQVVISILVLAGAGLLGRTVLNLEKTNPGFKTENLLVFNVDTTASGLKFDDPKVSKLNEDMRSRFAALPGVNSATYSLIPLLSDGLSGASFAPAGEPSGASRDVCLLPVGPGFFETMQIPLVEGRTFTRADFESLAGPRPIVVSRAVARMLFGNAEALGRIVVENQRPDDQWRIIGVVGDTKYENIRSEAAATAYTPHLYRMTTFSLRTESDPKALGSLVREAVAQLNPDYLVLRMATEREQIDKTIYQERLVAALAGLFGLLALVLASIGLYGLVAYGVARRTHEIGVRMALGAQSSAMLWLTAKLGLGMTLAGVVIGLAVAAGVTRYLQSLLYEVKPTDPWTFAGIAVLLACIAAVGCFIPARRAMQVDPVVALRHE